MPRDPLDYLDGYVSQLFDSLTDYRNITGM